MTNTAAPEAATPTPPLSQQPPVEKVKILVDAGADVNAIDSKGYPMLSKSRAGGKC